MPQPTQHAPATRAASSRRRPRAAPAAAEQLPVARVAVDISLAHLDRPFDYLVPERLAGVAVPGCRVRVRFAGQLTGGYLLGREAASEHAGRLAFLERVTSPEPVLTPQIAGLARDVADRYAGTLADVLRLAIPPRHAAAESARPGRPARSRPRSRVPLRGRGPAIRPARRSWPRSPTAGRPARPGRPCPARTGPKRSPVPPPRPPRPAAAPWSSSPTPGTSTSWTRRSARCWARTGTSA